MFSGCSTPSRTRNLHARFQIKYIPSQVSFTRGDCDVLTEAMELRAAAPFAMDVSVRRERGFDNE